MVQANRVSQQPHTSIERTDSREQELQEAISRLEAENVALREANGRLEDSLDELENYTAMAAHELLKPLVFTEASLTGVLERACSRLDLASQEDLRALMRASARVRLLVEALLTDLRPDAKPLRREHVDMAEVVSHCVELLGGDIKTRRARVKVEAMPVVPGNRALLNGAMGNLIANALKYGPRTGGEIHISAQRAGSGWVFEVDSGGRPIPERDRDRIFDPWSRAPGERRARGAGLGLAIVRRIVQRHGGDVGVQALNGRGNRFYFTLPAS